MSDQVRKFSLASLILALLSALAVHAQLGSSSRYIADDFCSAAVALRLGLLRATWYWYLNWTGRFAASALDAVFGLVGPAVTPWVPALVLVLWLAALVHAASALLGKGSQAALFSVGIAVSAVYLTLILSPNVPQALYWGQGMRSILPPLVLGTLHVDLLARTATGDWSAGRRRLSLLMSFLLAFATGGFNETFAALQSGGFLLAWLLVRLATAHETRRRLLGNLAAGTLGALLAVAAIIAAPGNAFRQAFYPPPPEFAHLLQIAWGHFAGFLVSFPRNSAALLAATAGAGLAVYIGLHLRARRPPGFFVPSILLIGIGLTYASFMPAAYGLSDAPPERTLLIPAHVIALTIFVAGIPLGQVLQEKLATRRHSKIIKTSIIIVAAASAMASAVLLDQDLISSRGQFAAYAANWDTNNARILRARDRGESEIWIQPMANWAALNEPNDNPRFWVNQCLSDYYGIDVLGLDIQ